MTKLLDKAFTIASELSDIEQVDTPTDKSGDSHFNQTTYALDFHLKHRG